MPVRSIQLLPPHTGASARHVAMPLGGIGTGSVAICGDGSLRQWQLHNTGNHVGFIPHTFFALRVLSGEPPLSECRLLQAAALPPAEPTPLVTDDYSPADLLALQAELRPMQAATFRAIYPFADISFSDDTLPVRVRMAAFNPLVPLNVEDSSLPVGLFSFTITSTAAWPVFAWLGATMQNAVGWDGITPITGSSCPLYGGNVNRFRRADGWAALIAENPGLPADHPGSGQMVLSLDDENAAVAPAWTHPQHFVRFLEGRAMREVLSRASHGRTARADPQSSGPLAPAGPSPAGQTWDGGLCTGFELQPGEARTIRVVLAWHFPNRYVNFDQFGPRRDFGHSRFWLGNHYTSVYPDAVAVAEDTQSRWHELDAASRSWTDTLLDSTLDTPMAQRLAAQAVPFRSPTCFRDAEGRFFGFEGVLGASTTMWSGDHGGSCPLNCTHVWNYAQGPSRLFPELERDMRQTEFDIMQAPEGYLPHRVLAPVYLRQLWGVRIGGPEDPALDGMLGAVLKTYREVRLGAGRQWLATYWPHVRRLIEYVRRTWDPHDSGVLTGIQPSTHDIDLCGVNSFMGTYWLAALLAGEQLACRVGEPAFAAELRELFDRGSISYDEQLWNGEFYIQRLQPGDSERFQWGNGCLSDQLVGQWWAHQLDLGYLLPPDHVRSALRSIVRYNLRRGFEGFTHQQRVFADRDDSGLLMCTWPLGGRPQTSVRYADEVWSGVEYQVAAHCLMEGLPDEAERILTALSARHDGQRRNPFNEIECGDHYARSMAGFSLLDAINGVRYDPSSQHLIIRPPSSQPAGRHPLLVADAWGTLDMTVPGRLHLLVRSGELPVKVISTPGVDTASVRLSDCGSAAPVAIRPSGTGFELTPPVRLRAGQCLEITDRQAVAAPGVASTDAVAAQRNQPLRP